MSFVVKKRDLTDPAQLQALIVEHADDLERGLTILDSRLMLGQATIDVVGLDAESSLVLIAVGLIGDEEMFLRAVEAYSWCLEYAETISRLYPAAQLSAARPPRVIFVVERMPDAFHRKIKQLGFHEVDCVEFRHLDVDGTPAVYFDTLARLRRHPVTTLPPTPVQSDRSATPTPPIVNGRSALKLQKLLGADRGSRESAPVVRMVHRAPARPESKPLASASRTERLITPRHGVDAPPATPRPRVDSPEPTRSVSRAGETLPPPIDRVTGTARVPESGPVPAAPPLASPELAVPSAVAEALADLLGEGVGASDAMVEAFVTIERAAENGHVVTLPNAIDEQPAIRAPERAVQPAEPKIHEPQPIQQREPEIRQPERAGRRPEPVTPPAVTSEAVISEPQPAEADEIAFDVLAAELTATADPVAPEPLTAEVVSAPEPQPVAATFKAPEPELVLELERPVVEQATESAPPVNETAEPNVSELEATVPQPSMESPEPILPVVAPPPAVSPFARRPAEAVATRAEPKVSFAGTVPVQLEDLAIDDRATTFAKPSGPFAKPPTLTRPRTIAPPPSDGQPIAARPKLAAAASLIATPAPAAEPAATAPAVETANAAPQSIEGVPFPNDGVLTRQWMEFLNQMAAGK